jgi:hypothetical protein
MAENAAERVVYYLSIHQQHRDDLARIRHWDNLKVGADADRLWVKDLDYAQVHTVHVKAIPFKTIYYEKDGKLYLINSLLPERSIPSVLWTPIERALPIQLPSFNHNYFGIHERAEIRLSQADTESEAAAMIVEIKVLSKYIESAPAIRLENIRWVVIDQSRAILLGKPQLPLPGTILWQRKDMLIPAGYDLELSFLADTIQTHVNPGRDSWIVWSVDGSYFPVSKENFVTLSRSSFRSTYTSLQSAESLND